MYLIYASKLDRDVLNGCNIFIIISVDTLRKILRSLVLAALITAVAASAAIAVVTGPVFAEDGFGYTDIPVRQMRLTRRIYDAEGKELYRAGLTQEAFAEKVGISARYVRVLCTRDVNVSIAVYYEILKVLNLPANSLLVYVDETHKKITLPAREGKKHDHKKKRSASALHQSSQS